MWLFYITTGDTRTVFPYDAILGELFSAETPPPAADAGTKNAFLSPILCQKRSVCQDRLGTNVGKVEKTRRFLQGLARWERYGRRWLSIERTGHQLLAQEQERHKQQEGL